MKCLFDVRLLVAAAMLVGLVVGVNMDTNPPHAAADDAFDAMIERMDRADEMTAIGSDGTKLHIRWANRPAPPAPTR